MGNSNNGCDCVSDENKVQLDGYVDMPALNKEDVNQIWKCFEYLNPKNGLVDVKSLQISKEDRDTRLSYMEPIIDEILDQRSDINFDQFFNIMKPKVLMLKAQNKNLVLMESHSTSVSCLICPYKASSSSN